MNDFFWCPSCRNKTSKKTGRYVDFDTGRITKLCNPCSRRYPYARKPQSFKPGLLYHRYIKFDPALKHLSGMDLAILLDQLGYIELFKHENGQTRYREIKPNLTWPSIRTILEGSKLWNPVEN